MILQKYREKLFFVNNMVLMIGPSNMACLTVKLSLREEILIPKS